jgi:hypothetical protein
MPDSKISALPAVVTPALTDEFVVNQGGVSKKITRQQIIDTERYMLRADATRNLSNVATEQALFDAAADTLTLPVGTYRFEAMIYLTAMSATSGNLAFDPVGAGTAVTAAWLYHAVGIDVAAPTAAAAQTGSFTITQQSVASIVSAATGTALGVRIEGMFEVTTAGTIIPSVTLVTAAAATVAIGTYFWAERISSSTTLTSIGPAS